MISSDDLGISESIHCSFLNTFQIALSVALWGAGLISRSSLVTASSENGINTGEVLVANLFCFSWGSFLASIVLACKWFNLSTKKTEWIILGVFGAALFASVRIYDVKNNNKLDCYQVGEYLGIVTAIAAILMVAAQQKVPVMARTALEILLFVAWSFTTGCIAFGENAPGASSIYFEIWSIFFLCLDIISTTMSDTLRELKKRATHHDEDVRQRDENDDEETQRRRNSIHGKRHMTGDNRIEVLSECPEISEISEILTMENSFEFFK